MTSAPRPLLAAPSSLAVGSLSVASPTPVPTSLLGSLVYAYSRFYAGRLVNPWSCFYAAAAFTSCATAKYIFPALPFCPATCLPPRPTWVHWSFPQAISLRVQALCNKQSTGAFQSLSRPFLSPSSSSVFPVIYV